MLEIFEFSILSIWVASAQVMSKYDVTFERYCICIQVILHASYIGNIIYNLPIHLLLGLMFCWLHNY